MMSGEARWGHAHSRPVTPYLEHRSHMLPDPTARSIILMRADTDSCSRPIHIHVRSRSGISHALPAPPPARSHVTATLTLVLRDPSGHLSQSALTVLFSLSLSLSCSPHSHQMTRTISGRLASPNSRIISTVAPTLRPSPTPTDSALPPLSLYVELPPSAAEAFAAIPPPPPSLLRIALRR